MTTARSGYKIDATEALAEHVVLYEEASRLVYGGRWSDGAIEGRGQVEGRGPVEVRVLVIL